MAIYPILNVENPVLHQKASPVERVNKDLRQLVDDMLETMRDADGMGLAAPQIGLPLRLFVAELDEKIYAFVNPQIIFSSDELETAEEGCLSLPGYRGEVERPQRVVVRGKNLRGRTQTVAAEGLLARCFQHEIDHLDGIIYTDRMKPGVTLHEVSPDEEVQEESA